MRALLSEVTGGPETLVLREVADPTPAAGQVCIAVQCCGINYPDALVIEDKYQARPPRPFSPGLEVSGVVDALGPAVSGLRIGDRVIAHVDCGGLAEKLVVQASHCILMPTSMPFDVAAGMLVTYGTSRYALIDRGELKSGETLLVLGAAGGVGLAAVDLGKAYGARVIAAVSSEAKAIAARKCGADEVIVYPREPSDQKSLSTLFKNACGERGADVIYDPVGGDYAEPALRTAAWRGRYLVIGFPAGIPRIPLNLPLLKGCDIRGVFMGAARHHEPEKYAAGLRELLALYVAGKIKPLISARYPLAEGGTAIAQLLRREVIGKIVVECAR